MRDANHQYIGLMSGTSLDGLDLVCVCFEEVDSVISYRLLASETIAYTKERQDQLKIAHLANASDLALLNVELGQFFGQHVLEFCLHHGLQPSYIGSHGHTIFHQPDKGLTVQIGDPFHIAAVAKIPVIAQFRNMDVALGGQGAPLVPIADEVLYGQYDACLNLGGIANISMRSPSGRIASDLCICNMLLNLMANRLHLVYDPNGQHASQGQIDPVLLQQLLDHPFYAIKGPKSLGKEFYEQNLAPMINQALEYLEIEDVLCTATEYMAQIIGKYTHLHHVQKCLVTGGGAYNSYLIHRIEQYTDTRIELGTSLEIEFKEAIAFALLAYLKVKKRNNVLKSVTGASNDHCAGVLYDI